MAINLPNFLQAPLPDTGRNWFENFVRGYQIPRQMRQMDEESRRRQQEIERGEMEAKGYPQRLEDEAMARQLANVLSGQRIQSEGIELDYLRPTKERERQLGEYNIAKIQEEIMAKQLENMVSQMNVQQRRAFFDELYGSGRGGFGGQAQPGMVGTSSQGGFSGIPMRDAGQSYEAQPQDMSAQGGDRYGRMDELFMNRPEFRKFIKELTPDAGVMYKTHPETGQMIKITKLPSGRDNVEATNIGKQPEDIARAKELAKSDVKFLEQNTETYNKGVELGEALSQLKSIVDEHRPLFDATTGQLQSRIVEYMPGSRQRKELLGVINSLMGKVTMLAAGEFKVAFRVGEQDLIDTIKGTSKDAPAMLAAKIKALSEVHEVAQKRRRLVADLVRKQGLSPEDALDIALDTHKLDKIFDKFKQEKKELSSKEFGNVVAAQSAYNKISQDPGAWEVVSD